MLPDNLCTTTRLTVSGGAATRSPGSRGSATPCFGFAVTLLIVSLEVPRTSTELLATMRGFGSFVITFMILAGMWYTQFTFFRRYGLEDRVTVVLNLVLLFTVLFFVYPMKFLFTTMFTRLTPRVHALVTVTAHGIEPMILPQHRPLIFVIFGAGFTAVFVVFVLLYRHAYKQRDKLELNEFEIYETRHSIRRMLISMCFGVTYFAIAALEGMPTHTSADKSKMETVSVVILVILVALLAMMMRSLIERGACHGSGKINSLSRIAAFGGGTGIVTVTPVWASHWSSAPTHV